MGNEQSTGKSFCFPLLEEVVWVEGSWEKGGKDFKKCMQISHWSAAQDPVSLCTEQLDLPSGLYMHRGQHMCDPAMEMHAHMQRTKTGAAAGADSLPQFPWAKVGRTAGTGVTSGKLSKLLKSNKRFSSQPRQLSQYFGCCFLCAEQICLQKCSANSGKDLKREMEV